MSRQQLQRRGPHLKPDLLLGLCQLLLPLPLLLRLPLRLAALAALLVGLELPKLLEPVQRPLEPLRRMLRILLD